MFQQISRLQSGLLVCELVHLHRKGAVHCASRLDAVIMSNQLGTFCSSKSLSRPAQNTAVIQQDENIFSCVD